MAFGLQGESGNRMMKKLFLSLLLCLMSPGYAATSNAADQLLHHGLLHNILPYGPLDDTIWISAASRESLQADRPEKAVRENGEVIDIHFLAFFQFHDPPESGYSIKVRGWNGNDNSYVNSSATLVSNGENSFVYTEHSDRPLSDFSGTKGHGILRIIDTDTAELTDVRRLADGSESTSVITLHRVDNSLSEHLGQLGPPAQ